MYRKTALFLLVLAAFVVGACSSQSQPAAGTTAPAATEVPAAAAEEPTTAPTAPAAESASAPAADALPDAVTYTVDTAASTASYGVDEVFLSDNRPFHAVGTANSVTGSLEVVAAGTPAGRVTQIRVDLRTLTSDSARRDNAIRQRWLESDTYPYADFVSTEALNLPAAYTEGSPVSFTLNGDLTVRDITIPTSWEVTGVLADGVITADATTKVTMSAFGFDPPNIAGMLRADDGVTLTVHIVAKAQP